MADLISILHRENTSLHLQIQSKDAEIKKLESRIDTLQYEQEQLETVKHAKWVNDTFCSNCQRFPVDVSVSISNKELTKYFSRCPHCGARMDLKE